MMDYGALKQDLIYPLLDILKTRPFNWDAVEKASLETPHPYGIVRLAFKDSLGEVLKELAGHFKCLINQSLNQEDFSNFRTPEKIRRSVEITFQILEPYKGSLRHSINKTTMVHLVPIGYQYINDLWYRAGDQSTDYNFYTKRLLLSMVFVPTFLLWLKEETTLSCAMAFFDKRLAQVTKIPIIKKKVLQGIQNFLDF